MNKTYKTNYSVAVNWLNNDFVMCNKLPEIDSTVWDNMMKVVDVSGNEEECEDEEDCCYDEIFQWFITDASESDVDFLREHFGLKFTYSELLECFVLCVDHYGTAWTYVDWVTDLEAAKRELGQKK